MAKASIALTELAEKGSDVDLVRDMLHLAAQLMEMDVEAVCGAPYGERTVPRENFPERLTRSGLGDAHRRNRSAHTQAAQGQLLPGVFRTPTDAEKALTAVI
jgi:putative transposase